MVRPACVIDMTWNLLIFSSAIFFQLNFFSCYFVRLKQINYTKNLFVVYEYTTINEYKAICVGSSSWIGVDV